MLINGHAYDDGRVVIHSDGVVVEEVDALSIDYTIWRQRNGLIHCRAAMVLAPPPRADKIRALIKRIILGTTELHVIVEYTLGDAPVHDHLAACLPDGEPEQSWELPDGTVHLYPLNILMNGVAMSTAASSYASPTTGARPV